MQNKTKYMAIFLAASAAFFVGVKQQEGYTADPVIPVKGDRPTQGHGTTVKPDGTPVKMTDPPITRQTADKWLRSHVAKDEIAFRKSLQGVQISQVEYDVYLDFVYNFCQSNWQQSSMLKNLKAGQYVQACQSLLKWKYVAKRDCSVRSNGCYGVWKRQLDRYEKCMGVQ